MTEFQAAPVDYQGPAPPQVRPIPAVDAPGRLALADRACYGLGLSAGTQSTHERESLAAQPEGTVTSWLRCT